MRALVRHGYGRRPDIREVFAGSRVLFPDLEGKFTGMAENKHRDFTVDGLDLLERGRDKHCCFIETRFGLTEDVGRGDGVGKTKSLDLSKMLETFSN
jgi:hypothetical protein